MYAQSPQAGGAEAGQTQRANNDDVVDTDFKEMKHSLAALDEARARYWLDLRSNCHNLHSPKHPRVLVVPKMMSITRRRDMSRFHAFVATAIWSATLLAISPAIAQSGGPGQPVVKDLEQNDKVRVYEAIFKPGDVSPSTKRSMRVVHALKGGTLERTYADGTKEKSNWKTGETRIMNEEREYAIKNVGKTKVDLLVTSIK
jgi:hypothetical protein